MNPVLEDIYCTGKCVDLAGKERTVAGGVPRADALVLGDMVRFVKAKTTLETGVAFGLSTLAICDALRETAGAEAKHYGVDPNQSTSYGHVALANLKRAGLDSGFELLEGPSYLMLPRCLEEGVVLDLGFIDGWHTFDCTFLDFFYIDKMLRPGGVLLLHDRSWPSKRKVIRFIRTHRRYKQLPVRSADQVFFDWLRGLFAAEWHWLQGAPSSAVVTAITWPAIAAFVKLESFEPGYHFFRDF